MSVWLLVVAHTTWHLFRLRILCGSFCIFFSLSEALLRCRYHLILYSKAAFLIRNFFCRVLLFSLLLFSISYRFSYNLRCFTIIAFGAFHTDCWWFFPDYYFFLLGFSSLKFKLICTSFSRGFSLHRISSRTSAWKSLKLLD